MAEQDGPDPSFQKNRRLPWFILGGLLGSVVLLFVVAAVSSSSWFGGTVPSSGDVVETEPTAALPVLAVDAGEKEAAVLEGPDAGAKNDTTVVPVDSISVHPSAIPPVVTVPKVVPRIPGTRPYLPDLP